MTVTPMHTNYNLYNDPLELYHYACSELGSNYISAKISNAVYFRVFFEKLNKFFSLLMVNGVGHSVCRAIYSQPHCSLPEKLLLLKSLIPEFVSIASNRQGSFAMICIMNLFSSCAEIEVLTKAFITCINDADKSKFDEIILSQSGYHVIKKYIAFGYPHFNCILHRISTDFTKYATHHYGVPIIRSILDMISMSERLVFEYQHCLQLFAQHTHSLVQNQYGNYVIQQLLDISPTHVSDTIKEFMSSKYSEYSQHKFASNVVEKCLKHTLKQIVEQQRRQFAHEHKEEEMDDAWQLKNTQEREQEEMELEMEEEEEEAVEAEQESVESDSDKENKHVDSNAKQSKKRRVRRKRHRQKAKRKKEQEKLVEHGKRSKGSKSKEEKRKKKSERIVLREAQRNWIRLIVQELLADAAKLINHKYGNYCLQTALSVLIELSRESEAALYHESVLLLQQFVNTVYPLLHLLRSNVKKKWQQLLIASTEATGYRHSDTFLVD